MRRRFREEIEKVFTRRFGRDHQESVALRGELADLKGRLKALADLAPQLASMQQRPARREDFL